MMLFEVKALKVQTAVSVECFATACRGGQGVGFSGDGWCQVCRKDLYKMSRTGDVAAKVKELISHTIRALISQDMRETSCVCER
jgi:hypothetical protein